MSESIAFSILVMEAQTKLNGCFGQPAVFTYFAKYSSTIRGKYKWYSVFVYFFLFHGTLLSSCSA